MRRECNTMNKNKQSKAAGIRGGLKRAAACCLAAVLAVTSVSVMPAAPKAAEADYSSLAQELPLNGVWGADTYLTDTNEEYWYRITIPSDGFFTYKLMYYMGDINWYLYNNDLSVTIASDYWLSGGTETAPETAEYSYSLSAGTYYLKVKKGDNGRFKQFASLESYGANDAGANSYDSPYSLSAGKEVTGALTKTDTEDWYRLTVPSDGHYAVKVTAYNSDIDYYIYNSDLSKTIGDEKYFSGSVTMPATKNFNYVLTAGTYYIKIKWYYSTEIYGKYLLLWNALTPENCVHEYDRQTVSPTYTQQGYTLFTCKNCGHTYQNNFQEKLTLGRVSLYRVTGYRKKLYVYYSTTSGAYGYQVRVSRNRNFGSGVKKYRASSNTSSGYVGKLKRKKKYYVQVRAYRTEDGVTIYGKWSNKKSARTK